MSVIIKSGSSGNLAGVDADGNLKVTTPQVTTTAGVENPDQVGAIRMFSEVDPGTVTGEATLISPEADSDFRLRVATDTIFDDETFNYTAQNTGKHNNQTSTMTFSYGTGGLLTNSASTTSNTTGCSIATYAMFPFFSSGVQKYDQFELSFSAQPVANTIVDWGSFHRPTSNPYAPTDGVYFRLTSAGVFGVINHNGTETTTSPFTFTYNNGEVYRFLILSSNSHVEFWINDILYGTIETPVGQAQPFMSAALPIALRHTIAGGAAGGVFQVTLRGYGVSVGGANIVRESGEIGNGMFGSYQGLSGGTMGTLANYANSTNPTAAVPTNTTAALGSGLGGQFWETASLALTTDGIICSYQVPAGTVSIPGKRLKINGIYLQSYIQTVIVGGPFVSQYSLAFGHTAVSLATAEAATTKAARRVPLPPFTQLVTAAQAVSTMVSQPGGSYMALTNPVYVNPGEFVALVTKHVGTVGTSGTIAHVVSFVYSWE